MLEVIGEIEKRQSDRAAAFIECARGLAVGKKIKIDTIEEVLRESGRTTIDLQRLVARIQKRIRLAAEVRNGLGLDVEGSQLTEQRRKLGLELEDARRRFEEASIPLNVRLSEIRELERRGREAERELLASCPYPELIQQLKQIDDERSALIHQQPPLNREARCEEDAKSFEQEAQRWPEQKAYLLDMAARRRRRSEAALAELERIGQKIAECDVAAKAVQEQMLLP
jgi:hypothetical protein